MNRGWRAYFTTLFLSFFGFVGYGMWAGYEHRREISEQVAQRAMEQYSLKTRLARPLREDPSQVYREMHDNMLQQALEQSKTAPLKERSIGPGDFPAEPDGR